MIDPFDTAGFAPKMSMCCVRSTSGIGNSARLPNISAELRCWGSWSVEVADELFAVPSTRRSPRNDSTDQVCAPGLPR